jgi:hypothetical protein
MWRSWRRAREQACSLRNRDDRASLDQLLGLQLLMLQKPQRRRYAGLLERATRRERRWQFRSMPYFGDNIQSVSKRNNFTPRRPMSFIATAAIGA